MAQQKFLVLNLIETGLAFDDIRSQDIAKKISSQRKLRNIKTLYKTIENMNRKQESWVAFLWETKM